MSYEDQEHHGLSGLMKLNISKRLCFIIHFLIKFLFSVTPQCKALFQNHFTDHELKIGKVCTEALFYVKGKIR